MPSLNAVLLIVLASLLAVGNVWYPAARSTMPLAINDHVGDLEMRREKHPGKDDEYLLKLRGGQVLQVDQPIAETIATGSKLEKQAWSRTLLVESKIVDLEWSADFRGMIIAMPTILVLLMATAAGGGLLRVTAF